MTHEETIAGLPEAIAAAAGLTEAERESPEAAAELARVAGLAALGLSGWLSGPMPVGDVVTVPGGLVVGGLSRVFTVRVVRLVDVGDVRAFRWG